MMGRSIAIAALLAIGCSSSYKSTAQPDAGDDDVDRDADWTAGCASDEECSDGNPCNGQEMCVEGSCTSGAPRPDGTPCEQDGVPGECEDEICVPLTCGDGSVDTGEECDDGNEVDGDGCDTTCLYSCHAASECDDASPCTDDSCRDGGTGRRCAYDPNTDACDDGDVCTDPDACDGHGACVGVPLARFFRDADGDGYGDPADVACASSAPAGYVPNDDDCCDSNPSVNPGQTEWFSASFSCGLTASFDYDCSGVEERFCTSPGSCTLGSDGTCVLVAGWSLPSGTDPPPCGRTGPWISDCSLRDGGCFWGTGVATVQRCH